MQYRLYGGPRDGDLVDTLPDGYDAGVLGHGVGASEAYPMSATWAESDEPQSDQQ